MKPYIDALIVVEGVTDIQHLSKFIDAEFVHTNGSAILPSTLCLIGAALKKGKRVIVFTDPDYPGEKIRQEISKHFPNVAHAFVSKQVAIQGNKVGIAQTCGETLLTSLSFAITPKTTNLNPILPYMIAEIGLVGLVGSKILREKIASHFHIGETNVKTLVKRLNFLGISYDELRKVVNQL